MNQPDYYELLKKLVMEWKILYLRKTGTDLTAEKIGELSGYKNRVNVQRYLTGQDPVTERTYERFVTGLNTWKEKEGLDFELPVIGEREADPYSRPPVTE